MNPYLSDWLREFRASTPRDDRQRLIDTLNLEEAVAELPRRYRRLVYVLAARALQHGPEVFPVEARRAIVAAMSAKVKHRDVGRDLSDMVSRLDRDHRAWAAHRAQRVEAVDATTG
jgi:hypothetical protein